MNEEKVEMLLRDVDQLPTLPVMTMKLLRLLDDKNSSVADLAKCIESDQVQSSKLLRLVNSAYFGFRGKISTISKAVVILGYKAIRQLALGTSLIKVLPAKEMGLFKPDVFWKHSLYCAILSKLIGIKINYPEPEELFLAGLMHDIGTVVEFHYFPDKFIQVLNAVGIDGKSIIEAEKEVFGVDHTIIGSWLASKWGFPEIFVKCTRYHHLTEPIAPLDKQYTKEICCVFIANIVSKHIENPTNAEFLNIPKNVRDAVELRDDQLFESIFETRSISRSVFEIFQIEHD